MSPTPDQDTTGIVETVRAKVVDPLTDFLDDEVLGGLLLLIAAVVAVAWANSPWSDAYFDLWHTHVAIAGIDLDLHGWVNDLLMAVFFFVVGMEIKRELVTGELRDRRAAALPAIAAAGGVLLPALIYLLVVSGSAGEAAGGWAVPAATDIAFAVGVLALLGARVASGVRLFLLSIAIVDDLIAIAIIALVYSSGLSAAWFAIALAAVALVVVLQRLGVAQPLAYLLPAAVLWVAVFESGVHATIAGVLLGLLMPARPFRGRDVHTAIEHRIHPLSAYVIVPLFALANAGVDFRDGVLADALSEPVTWGVAGGLVVGKLVGITAATLVTLKLRLGRLPAGMERSHVAGVAALGGIGFTVSLFVAELAFDDPALTDAAKVGIFIASLVAGALGTLLLLARRRAGGAAGAPEG